MKIFNQFTAFGFLCLSAISYGQEMQTDRPNETENPTTVSKHLLQVESGFSYQKQEEQNTIEAPEVVFRYGLFKDVELRVESIFKLTHEENKKDVYGLEPVTVGVKYHILDHKDAIPDVALLGRLTIPWLADNIYKEEKYSPEVRMLAQHNLSKSAHLGYNFGVHWLPTALQPEYIYTLSADYAISKKVKVVGEAYGFAQTHHHAQNTADVALLFLVNNDLQLDLITGSGIMHSFSDKFIEIGLSFRI